LGGDSPAAFGGLGPGSRVAGYVLEKLVGAGGMAAVFRAHDERLGRVVALKLLAGDEAAKRRFVREARAVAAVDHPHVIPVYEAGEAAGVMFIAMRFVAGDDLQVIVSREGALRPKRAASFISAVASALDASHAAGLLHRDVKPANMLVDTGRGRPEHVYLSDFGLARGVVSADALTKAGQFFGTPDYVSPEQINGLPAGPRADQYGLACVAYALLGGAPPFKREDPMAVLYAHMYKAPPRLTAARPDLPQAVDRVIARGLAKAPDERFDSCGAFGDALREALGLEPYDPSIPASPSGQASVVTPAWPVPAPLTRTRLMPTPPDSVGSVPVAAAPLGPTALYPVTPAAVTWTAVVTADRAYYNSVQALNDEDTASISFPAVVPERRFPLSGTEVRIGRRSVSRRIEPEIDLTGPPTDPGVSRLHAVLVAGPDRQWSIVDSGSPNGIQVNGKDVPSGQQVPLRDGDRIHLGAWTMITITCG